MNYQKHYDALVERAKCRTLSGYSELHHVTPKCLGGGNEPSNLVRLTAEEHFVAHQLLVKLNPGNSKLVLAAANMTISPIGARNNNKRYSWLKRVHSSTVCGVNHHNYGKPLSEEQKAKLSLSLRGKKPSEEALRKRSEAMLGAKNPMFGKKISQEASAKFSEQRLGSGNSFYGKKHSEETKRVLSEQRKNKPLSAEHRAKLVAAWERRKAAERQQHLLKGAVV